MRGILHHLPFREPNQETIAKSSKASKERSYGAERPHELVKPENMASRENVPRSMARSTRCQPQRRCTTKGKTARARLPLVWTRRPVIMTIRTMPMQKAVPDGKGWIRLCTAAAARDTGSVLGSGGTG